MPEIDELGIGKPQRQSAMGVVVYLLRNFRAFITLAITFIALAASNPVFLAILGFAAVPVAILFGVLAYYQYRSFTFHVEDCDLIINKGIFFKERIVVRADRIQSIQITENIVQRMLKLVALKVDTAGSQGNELEIPALRQEVAKELKDLLYRKKENASSHGKFDDQNQHVSVEDVGQVLVELSFLDLLKVGITENHLKTGLIAVAFVIGTLSQYEEFIMDYVDDSVDDFAAQAAQTSLTIISVLILLYILISILLSMIRVILNFYDLKATLKSEAVEIQTGLLKRNNFRVPIHKIQYVKWEINPLRQAMGYESAKLKPSNSVGEVAKKEQIEIPALKLAESQTLAHGIFPNYTIPNFEVQADAISYARITALIALLLIIPVSIMSFISWGYLAALLYIIVPVSAVLAYFYGRSVCIYADGNFLVIKKGWFFRSRVVVPTYKMQSLRLSQNIFIEKRGLSHVEFFTAAGTLSIRYMPTYIMRELYDFILFIVERSENDWM